MAVRKPTGGITSAAVDATLPRALFVKRGDIRAAFGFTAEEMRVLVDDGTFVAKYPFGKTRKGLRTREPAIVTMRQRFLRSQVMAVAKRWEEAA